MPAVFLSYSSKDRDFARQVVSKLQDNGVRVWIDEVEIDIGDSLTERIGDAITEVDFIAVILSNHSINSAWVRKELALAMNRELAEQQVKVLPILMEKCDIPAFLKDKLYADFTDPMRFDHSFQRLLRALRVRPINRPLIRKDNLKPEETEFLREVRENERKFAIFSSPHMEPREWIRIGNKNYSAEEFGGLLESISDQIKYTEMAYSLCSRGYFRRISGSQYMITTKGSQAIDV